MNIPEVPDIPDFFASEHTRGARHLPKNQISAFVLISRLSNGLLEGLLSPFVRLLIARTVECVLHLNCFAYHFKMNSSFHEPGIIPKSLRHGTSFLYPFTL